MHWLEVDASRREREGCNACIDCNDADRAACACGCPTASHAHDIASVVKALRHLTGSARASIFHQMGRTILPLVHVLNIVTIFQLRETLMRGTRGAIATRLEFRVAVAEIKQR